MPPWPLLRANKRLRTLNGQARAVAFAAQAQDQKGKAIWPVHSVLAFPRPAVDFAQAGTRATLFPTG